MDANRLLIGLLTCHAHRERDVLCLDTWIPVARALGMRVVFLIGDGRKAPPTHLDGDYLRIPCQDTYQALPQKSHGFFAWAAQQPGWDFVAKGDNDSLIIPDRLAAVEMAGADYLGCEPGGRWVGYASGAFYLLSRRAVEIAAERMTERVGAEDVCCGRAMRKAGIRLRQDQRIDPWGRNPPTLDNEVFATHHLEADRWREVWGRFCSRAAPAQWPPAYRRSSF